VDGLKATALAAVLFSILLFGCLAVPKNNATATPAITATPTLAATPVQTPTPTPSASPSPTPEPKTSVVSGCSTDADCDWVVTTCCPPTVGGTWECVNEKNTTVYCPANRGPCTAAIPRIPSEPCVCLDKTCHAGGLNFSQAASRIEDAVNFILNQSMAPRERFAFTPAVDFAGTVVSYEKRMKYFFNPGSLRAAPASKKIEFVLTLKPAPGEKGGAYFSIEQAAEGRKYYVERGEDFYGNKLETKASFSCGGGKFLVTVNDDLSFDYMFSGFWNYDYDKEQWVNIPMKEFISALMKACP